MSWSFGIKSFTIYVVNITMFKIEKIRICGRCASNLRIGECLRFQETRTKIMLSTWWHNQINKIGWLVVYDSLQNAQQGTFNFPFTGNQKLQTVIEHMLRAETEREVAKFWLKTGMIVTIWMVEPSPTLPIGTRWLFTVTQPSAFTSSENLSFIYFTYSCWIEKNSSTERRILTLIAESMAYWKSF